MCGFPCSAFGTVCRREQLGASQLKTICFSRFTPVYLTLSLRPTPPTITCQWQPSGRCCSDLAGRQTATTWRRWNESLTWNAQPLHYRCSSLILKRPRWSLDGGLQHECWLCITLFTINGLNTTNVKDAIDPQSTFVPDRLICMRKGWRYRWRHRERGERPFSAAYLDK